jgi:hypothetical protein
MASYKDVIVDALEKKYEAQMAQAEANVKQIKDAKEILDELKNWR